MYHSRAIFESAKISAAMNCVSQAKRLKLYSVDCEWKLCNAHSLKLVNFQPPYILNFDLNQFKTMHYNVKWLTKNLSSNFILISLAGCIMQNANLCDDNALTRLKS